MCVCACFTIGSFALTSNCVVGGGLFEKNVRTPLNRRVSRAALFVNSDLVLIVSCFAPASDIEPLFPTRNSNFGVWIGVVDAGQVQRRRADIEGSGQSVLLEQGEQRIDVLNCHSTRHGFAELPTEFWCDSFGGVPVPCYVSHIACGGSASHLHADILLETIVEKFGQ